MPPSLTLRPFDDIFGPFSAFVTGDLHKQRKATFCNQNQDAAPQPENPTAAGASSRSGELRPQEYNFQKTMSRCGLAKVAEENRPKENPKYGVRQVRALKPHRCPRIYIYIYLFLKKIAIHSAIFLLLPIPLHLFVNTKRSPTAPPYESWRNRPRRSQGQEKSGGHAQTRR